MKKIIFILLVLSSAINLKAQEILIENNFNKDTILLPFNQNDSINSLKISGTVKLHGDNSLVRIILTDNQLNEYLAYEAYPLISLTDSFSISDTCYETCYMNSVIPVKIEIQINDAEIYLQSLHPSYINDPVLKNNVHLLKGIVDSAKVNLIKFNIQNKGLLWTAGYTSFAALPYSEKKKYFDNDTVPNLQGFEYYEGGIFEIKSNETDTSSSQNKLVTSSDLVENFDWGNRHGSNNPLSTYYNNYAYINSGNTTYSRGWMPPLFYGQGGYHCWAFAAMGAVQGAINLYFNQHLDADENLSIQDVLTGTGQCNAWYINAALDYIKNNGIVDNDCYSYMPCPDPPGKIKCSDPAEHIYISGYTGFNSTIYYNDPDGHEVGLKKMLINNGPLASPIYPWSHAMTLVGYGTLHEGTIWMQGNSHDIFNQYTIPAGSPLIGKTYWIFRQSWEPYMNGSTPPYGWICDPDPAYVYVVVNINQLGSPYSVDMPIISKNFDEEDIQCNDLDGDGYYWWGLGTLPVGCSGDPAQEDCDDSNPFFGPYDTDTYKCQVLCDNFVYNSNPLTITDDMIWMDDQMINRDIVIQSGKTLKIFSTISFQKDCKVIVEPGGKLVLDGGSLTNSDCSNNLWQGIEVWGDEHQSQLTAGAQGIVELKNGATIENAEIGISTMIFDANGDWVSGVSGGIIKANGAIFRNNKIGVQFDRYWNFNPNPPYHQMNDLSYFKNCLFETTAELNDPSIKPDAFVKLYSVKGIFFLGNTFQNTRTGDVPFNEKGSGIIGYDASFTVSPLCLTPYIFPCTLYQPSTFSGLTYGISALNMNPLIHATIAGNTFNNNYRAIEIAGMRNAVISNNSFDVGDVTAIYEPAAYGVYLEGCTGYTIENNDFTTNAGSHYGLIINNSGKNPNLVYDNTFSNFTTAACQAEGINASKNIWGVLGTGLVFKCNTFTNAFADIAVTSGRIARNQGLCSSDTKTPAGNIFTTGIFANIFANPGEMSFTYNFHTPISGYNTTPTVNNPLIIHLNQCTTQYDPAVSCIIPSGGSSTTLKTAITASTTQLNSYNALFDGGSTQNLLDKIATPSINSGQLKNYLLSGTPYLTDTVLISTLNRPQQLTPGHLKQVFVPNSPLTSDVMDVLTTKVLPPGIRKQIIDAQVGTSQRSILEQQVASKDSIISTASDELIRNFTSDTLLTGIDSILAFFPTVMNAEAARTSAEAYTIKNNCAQITAMLSRLSTTNREDSYFIQYFQVLADLCSTGKTIYELTPAQKQTVIDVAASNTVISVNARVLLSLIDTAYKFVETIEDLKIPDSLAIRGSLYENSDCGYNPVAGDTLVFKDEWGNIIETVTPVATDENGYFLFDPVEFARIDSNTLYTISTKSGFSLDTTEFKTTAEWLQESPLYLTQVKINLEWQKEYGQDDSLYTMQCEIDLNGNIYVLGTGTQNPEMVGGSSLNLLKFNPSGELIWAELYDGNSHNYWASGFSVDSSQNVYVTGTRIDYSTYYNDIVIIKYDSNGTKLWEQLYNHSGLGAWACKSITDNFGNTYITGVIDTLAFVLKYNSGGTLIWEQDIDITTGRRISPAETKLDMRGNLYIIGNYESFGSFIIKCNPSGDITLIDSIPNCSLNTIEIAPGGNIYVAGKSIIYLDSINTIPVFYTAKYNIDGVLQWEQTKFVEEGNFIGGIINAMAVDSAENVVVVGLWGLGFSVIKYDINGNEIWSSFIPGDWYHIFSFSDLDLDIAGNIYITSTIETASVGFVLTNIYTFKFSPDGSELWEVNTSGASTDIDVSANGNIYVIGTKKMRIFDEPPIVIIGTQPNLRPFRTYYSLVLNKYSQCYSNANLLKVAPTADNSNTVSDYLKLYPNPNDGTMNVEYSIPDAEKGIFVLLDVAGQTIFTKELTGGKNTFVISENSLQSGIYYYRAKVGNRKIAADKIVVIK